MLKIKLKVSYWTFKFRCSYAYNRLGPAKQDESKIVTDGLYEKDLHHRQKLNQRVQEELAFKTFISADFNSYGNTSCCGCLEESYKLSSTLLKELWNYTHVRSAAASQVQNGEWSCVTRQFVFFSLNSAFSSSGIVPVHIFTHSR